MKNSCVFCVYNLGSQYLPDSFGNLIHSYKCDVRGFGRAFAVCDGFKLDVDRWIRYSNFVLKGVSVFESDLRALKENLLQDKIRYFVFTCVYIQCICFKQKYRLNRVEYQLSLF